jgi:predicted amidohydrolase
LLKAASPAATVKTMHVAGLQVQPTIADELAPLLDKLLREHAQAELILLSEYAFQTPPPAELRAWCRRTGRYLVAGGKEFIDERTFYNTAFVVDPRGEIVFRQPKCVPVQFFRDGVPAPEQHVWGSPWGKIGLCLCYDLAYRRVVDRLVALGAQAILVPTLDELHWGRQEHEHHARVAPVRAAEMGVPIFRIGSCGIPQLVDARGQTLATAPFPGEGAMIGGELQVGQAGRRPLDHRLAPLCVGVTGVLWPWLAFAAWRDRRAAALNLEPRDSSAA